MGNRTAAVTIGVLLWCLPMFAQQDGQQIYTRAEVQELSLAYRSVITSLEAQLSYYEQINQSLQAQLSAHRNYQAALEENNKVLRELAGGKKKSKLDWVWWGAKSAATLFTACEAAAIC